MNKTITINLGGINFHIDENAYIQLKQYLDSVSASLDPESRKETLEDIEARIAELFLDRLQDPSKVVSQPMVEDIIRIMGQPEDYKVGPDEESETTAAKTTQSESRTEKGPKKLYRDIENRTIAGVCSGLGYYFGINRVWTRLIFLLLLVPIFSSQFFIPTGQTILLIYIILWIVVPGARTTTQKLEMQGEKIDIDNIQRKVKEEYQNVKEKLQNGDYHKAESVLDKLGQILLVIVKGLIIFMGAIIVFVAGISLIAVVVSLFSLGAISIAGMNPIYEMVEVLPHLPDWVVYFCALILTGIPLLLLLFLGIKIIRPKNKVISTTAVLVLVGIWVLAFVPLIVGGTLSFSEDRRGHTSLSKSERVQNMLLETPDTLVVTTSPPLSKSGNENPKSFITLSPHSRNVLTTSKRGDDNTPEYSFEYERDTLWINRPLALTQAKNKRDELKASLYLTDSIIFKIDTNAGSIFKNLPAHYSNHWLRIKNGRVKCLDCDEEDETSTPSPDENEWYQDSTTTPQL